ncbi:hypothetical protein [Dyadobacter sp. SG02]|uniref:hypothetical protein n=1 Tax=Dyadobacter sp. SG02 TaxID=1855291 RepID=UPI00115FEC3F|nr:hypothetical protein [Dyadobacter sp. SG02]
MPRSSGVNVAESYMQLLDRTLPPILKRWQDMGLRRDVDFWVRRFPPRNAGLNMPYVSPETAEHSIFMRVNRHDVSVMRMVSQDRPGSSNGMSIDWYEGDESKLLNKGKIDSELAPTNRGNERYFRDCHLHHSVMFTTDMPTSASAKWILEYEKELDPEANEIVLAAEQELFAIRARAGHRGHFTRQENYRIAHIQKELSKIRKALVFYSEASTLDNIDVLGIEYIKKLKRNLADFIFRTSVLNERPGKVEHSFYPDLSDIHCYSAIDYSFVDGQAEGAYGRGQLNDCRKDLDLDKSQPLEVALDVGGKINNLVAGQESMKTLSFLNAMDVLHPEKIAHLAVKFAEYYKYYYRREVIVYYDSTHIPRNSVSEKNPLDEFVDTLNAQQWNVTPYAIGATPSYYNRYQLWSHVLGGRPFSDSEMYRARFNRSNTQLLRTAMEMTALDPRGKTGFEKYKGMERDNKADQQQAPHYTDAADTLLFGMIKRRRFGIQPQSSLIEF